MAPTIKIAVIQFEPKAVDPEANFTKSATYIRDAASQGAHLAILPEYHLTSWEPNHPSFIQSCHDSVPYLTRYIDLAKELSIHIVPGTIIEPVSTPSTKENTPGEDIGNNVGGGQVAEAKEVTLELRNISVFISSIGKLLSTYQKKNLWHAERGILTPDKLTPHTSFTVPFPDASSHDPNKTHDVQVGMLICWDLAFPEAFRSLISPASSTFTNTPSDALSPSSPSGANLILIPSFWELHATIPPEILALNPLSEPTFLDSVTVARAYENTCCVVLCNAFGQSQVAMPVQGCLGKLERGEEVVMVREVDVGVLKLAEEVYGIRGDLGAGGWHYKRHRGW